MPHWTLEGSDKVVYATVDEAHSGSADVSSYLFTLKKDLHIGENGDSSQSSLRSASNWHPIHGASVTPH